jgi:flagellar hook-associated protein 1 FlgK
MPDLLNIGARALTTTQLALSTTGHNIANVNTAGYSRQSVTLNAVEGQFSGSGYYGNGVEAQTVTRKYDQFLTRQVQLTTAIAASDEKRHQYLAQLEDLFPSGKNGLGASVSDMLNAFSDVASSPSDLSARTVVLARAEQMSTAFQGVDDSLQMIRSAARSEIGNMVTEINSIAGRIASLNKQVSAALGAGHTPNDLLDQRDQLIKDLNGLVQTTVIPANDGTVGIFVAGSQALVLGTRATPLTTGDNEFGDLSKLHLEMQINGVSTELNATMLGGGALSGLLQFHNDDLGEAGNLLGRMAMAIGTAINEQHHLGLDLQGNPGGDLFMLGAMPNVLPSERNTGGASMAVAIQTTPTSGVTRLQPSDYEVTFTGPDSGMVRRVMDGQETAFSSVPVTIDGLDLQVSGAPAAGDRFLVTPLRSVAGAIDTTFSSPRALAMASPVAAAAGPANQGTLTLTSLVPVSADPNLSQTVTVTFTSSGTFDVSGVGTGDPTGLTYAPGQTISFNGWSMTLKGVPQAGDTYSVQANTVTNANAGNAEALVAIRDRTLFDGAAATEGYAALLSQVGVRVQAASYSAAVSRSIATNTTNDQAAVSGVNLDEEAAKLLQFQQSYQASARILQVAQTLFDTLMQNVAS